jgi:hypothetical protein
MIALMREYHPDRCFRVHEQIPKGALPAMAGDVL